MVAPLPPDNGTVDRRESTVIRQQGGVAQTPPTTPPVVETTRVPPPASVQAQHAVADYAAEQRANLTRVTKLISFVFGLFVALILIRVLLSAIGANEANAFAQFIYNVTAPLVAPFVGLTGTPQYGGAALEVSAIVAAIVYALVGWGINKLIWLLFYRPTTSEVSTTTYHRS